MHYRASSKLFKVAFPAHDSPEYLASQIVLHRKVRLAQSESALTLTLPADVVGPVAASISEQTPLRGYPSRAWRRFRPSRRLQRPVATTKISRITSNQVGAPAMITSTAAIRATLRTHANGEKGLSGKLSTVQHYRASCLAQAVPTLPRQRYTSCRHVA
jgi:hypothetical protein